MNKKNRHPGWILLLLCTIVFTFAAGCTASSSTELSPPRKREIPSLVRTTGTRDLMEEAVSLSGYAGLGLSELSAYGYGKGIFSDYLTIHSSPLTAANYVLSVQQAARTLNSNGLGTAEFYEAILNKTGFHYDTDIEYPVYTDLLTALETVYTAAGEDYSHTDLKKIIRNILPDLRRPLACWLSAAAQAYILVTEQTADLTDQNFRTVNSFSYTHCATTDIWHLKSIENLAQNISEEAVQKAGMLLISATARLSAEWKDIPVITRRDKPVVIPTPAGDIILGSSQADSYDSPNSLLLVDPGGDDTYNGRIAASSSLSQCLSVVLDLSGNDTYASGFEPSQGCGLLGCGLLFDLRGTDTYTAKKLAQGCAIIGTGVLYDGEGNDSYSCLVTGQASGFYGTAMLMDATGDDTYDGYGFVQASAGNRCVAYLVDGSGDDRYETPVDTPRGYPLLDYGSNHSGKNGGFSQGCGWGQRNIGWNGLAGGIAGLIDFGGDDSYIGGLWVQGTGYWSGIGFIYDESGNDEYNAYYYSQASVAHYGAGLLLDNAGTDIYTLTLGAGLSFVWDRGVSILLDDSGNDNYICFGSHGGVANSYYDEKGLKNQNMTYAFFLDAQGNDEYWAGSTYEAFGHGRGGYFLDCDGEDSYHKRTWKNEEVLSEQFYQQGGVFIDASPAGDDIPFFSFWEEAKKNAGFTKIE